MKNQPIIRSKSAEHCTTIDHAAGTKAMILSSDHRRTNKAKHQVRLGFHDLSRSHTGPSNQVARLGYWQGSAKLYNAGGADQ